jgi:protein-cysteine N-palmitoyltransferase HHAT
MTILSFFRDLYSLDTLDTRFTTSSQTPLKTAAKDSAKTTSAEDSSSSRPTLPAGASPPRWQTPEFYVYLLVFLFCVPNMYLAVVAVSQPTSPNYSKYEDLLSDGWLFGRKVDNSDGQYAGFRDNIPYLTLLVIFHPLARRAYEALMGASPTTQANGSTRTNSTNMTADQRLRTRLTFDFYSSLFFISALHGFSAFKILLILYINFAIANRLPREAIPPATWIFNICILFANEFTRGYSYGSIMEAMAPFYAEAGNWGKFLDSWGGIIPRWEVSFNITVLRLISFNMDHYWAMDRSRSGSPLEVS